MALSQNQFTISTLTGTLVQGESMSFEFYNASASAVVTAGEFVQIEPTTGLSPTHSLVSVGAGLTAPFFGVVLTKPLTDSFAVKAGVDVAFYGSVVMLPVSAAVAAGDKLQYDPSTKKVATQTASNTIVGKALESATTDGQLIRVFITCN